MIKKKNMFKESLFYPLYKDEDKAFFAKLKLAIKDKYQFVGNEKEKEYFLKSLLCLQMLKDYRSPILAIYENLQQTTKIEVINDQVDSQELKIEYDWAVWKRDKEMGKLADELMNSKLGINGSNNDFNEFVLRYLVSIWLIDWEGPLFTILQETKSGLIDLQKLNNLLELWDFTALFATY